MDSVANNLREGDLDQHRDNTHYLVRHLSSETEPRDKDKKVLMKMDTFKRSIRLRLFLQQNMFGTFLTLETAVIRAKNLPKSNTNH